ncbi:hypothetical protein SLEP1_g50624 [Rubroshorea leprosula]|uniref:SKP1 component dimerisation domain-containing protein n=1 Tax=Rubroshorea leprosula TaxID=152421 RepID=A0AAV5M1F2_9ROSI|nr:hypothetical protein SLEP1_g50624 [Rubroshorea leprosula]
MEFKIIKSFFDDNLDISFDAVVPLTNANLKEPTKQPTRSKKKSMEYVRRFFDIENDYTPEEEARVRAKNAWAFEGVDPDNDVMDSDVVMDSTQISIQ